METLIDLKQKRASAIEAQGKMISETRTAGVDFTDAQETEFNRLDTEIRGLDSKIEKLEKVEAAEKRAAELNLARDRSHARGDGEFSKKEEKEFRNYSLKDAINLQLSKAPLSGFVAEMHEEARNEARSHGKSVDGLGIPTSLAVRMISGEKRAMNATTGADGGFLVQTDVDSSIIEALRPKLVLAQAGAITLGNLEGNLDIPKNGGVSVSWKTENGAANGSTPVVGRLNLTPKRVTAFTDVSRQLLAQSSVGVERMLRDDFFNAIASAIDKVGILGGGTNEPTGILATAGIGAAYAGGAANNSVNANGIAPIYKDLINLEKAVAVANGDVNQMAFLMNPQVRGVFRGTEISSGSGRFGMETNDMAAGYRAFTTTNVPNDLTKGTSDNLSAIIFGDFTQMILAQWGGLDLLVNPYTKGKEGLVEMIVHQYVDTGLRHDESFAAIKDALAL